MKNKKILIIVFAVLFVSILTGGLLYFKNFNKTNIINANNKDYSSFMNIGTNYYHFDFYNDSYHVEIIELIYLDEDEEREYRDYQVQRYGTMYTPQQKSLIILGTYQNTSGISTYTIRQDKTITNLVGWYTQPNGAGQKLFDAYGNPLSGDYLANYGDAVVYPYYQKINVNIEPSNFEPTFNVPTGATNCYYNTGNASYAFGNTASFNADTEGTITCNIQSTKATFVDYVHDQDFDVTYTQYETRPTVNYSETIEAKNGFSEQITIGYKNLVFDLSVGYDDTIYDEIDGSFAGYCTQPNGEGICLFDSNLNYTSTEPILSYGTNITLYAYYTATYNIRSNNLTYWNTQKDGSGETYSPGRTINSKSSGDPYNLLLYDAFESKTINFNNPVSSFPQTFSYNSSYKINNHDNLKNAVEIKSNYIDGNKYNNYYEGTFKGYCSQENGNGTCYVDADGNWKNIQSFLYLDDEIDLYAYYEVSIKFLPLTEEKGYISSWNTSSNGSGTNYLLLKNPRIVSDYEIINLYEVKTKKTTDNISLEGNKNAYKVSDLTKDNSSIKIYNQYGQQLSNNDIVSTGCIYESNNVYSTIIITGDLDGDGIITATDTVYGYSYFFKSSSVLSGAYLQSFDMDGNGKYEMVDYVLLYNKFMNKKSN